MKYLTKPVPVEAIRWDGTNKDEILKFCERRVARAPHQQGPTYHSGPVFEGNICILEAPKINTRKLNPGDWLVSEKPGEYWPCHDTIFTRDFEPAPSSPAEFDEISADQAPNPPALEPVLICPKIEYLKYAFHTQERVCAHSAKKLQDEQLVLNAITEQLSSHGITMPAKALDTH